MIYSNYNPIETLFFDVETTGLYYDDEIVSISIIDGVENIILDTLVKPIYHKSWRDASLINNIYPKDVYNSPTMEQLKTTLTNIFNNAKTIIAYNIAFDTMFIDNIIEINALNKFCCMIKFDEVYGEWSDYFFDYKRQKLTIAMNYYNLKWKGKFHTSLADTFACRDVWLKMYPNFFSSQNIKID